MGTEFAIWLSEAGGFGEVEVPGCVGESTVPPVAVELGETGAGAGAGSGVMVPVVVPLDTTPVTGAASVYCACPCTWPNGVFARTV